jgi:hypothetical protein
MTRRPYVTFFLKEPMEFRKLLLTNYAQKIRMIATAPMGVKSMA